MGRRDDVRERGSATVTDEMASVCGTLPGPPLALSQESIRRGLRLRHMDALQHFCTLRRGDLSPAAPTQMEDRNLAH